MICDERIVSVICDSLGCQKWTRNKSGMCELHEGKATRKKSTRLFTPVKCTKSGCFKMTASITRKCRNHQPRKKSSE